MRLLPLLSLAGTLALSTGCVIAVNTGDGDGWWHDDCDEDDDDCERDDDDDDRDEDDGEDDGEDDDTAAEPPAPALDVTVTLDPAGVAVGDDALLLLTLTGEAGTADLVGLDFGDGVAVADARALDAETLALAVAVADDAAPGPRDLWLDFGDRGSLTVEGLLHVGSPEGDTGVACE